MRLPEQRLWDRFRRAGAGRIAMERVENVVTKGTPDVFAACRASGTLPIELKAVEELPARASTPVLGEKRGLTPDQRNFHIRWARFGAPTLILVGLPGGEIAAWPGVWADEINAAPLELLRARSVAATLPALITLLAGPEAAP